MKGYSITTYGDPSVLTFSEDLPLPKPAPNQVRIKVHATSINPLDLKVRSGALSTQKPINILKHKVLSGRCLLKCSSS